MKFENTEVFNLEGALRGMRNPKESWDKSDSYWCSEDCPMVLNEDYPAIECNDGKFKYCIGKNDMKLAQTLIKAGSEHRKFMRQIFVSVDITAPLYWWSEYSTYKVGTTENSTSKMHKLASTKITRDCFEMDDYYSDSGIDFWGILIDRLEYLRNDYNLYKDKRVWKELIRLLPESWLQTRTVTMNYENLYTMIYQRKYHKLNEWSGQDNPQLPNFISWARELPYAQEFFFMDETENANEK